MPDPTTTPTRCGSPLFHIEARIGKGFLSRRNREVEKTIHAAGCWLVHVLRRVEVLDLAGDVSLESGVVELRQRSNARAAGQKCGPGGGNVVAERGHKPEAGGDHALGVWSSQKNLLRQVNSGNA